MSDVNSQFLLSLIIIAIGYAGKKLKWYTQEDGTRLSKIVLNITLPALVLHTFSTVTIDFHLSILPIIGLCYAILIAVTAFIIFRKKPNVQKGLYIFSLLGFNIGLFALPLVKAIWGVQGLSYLMMFDISNAFVIFAFSFSVAQYFSPDNKKPLNIFSLLKRLIFFVPLLGYIIALVVNLLEIQFFPLVYDILEIFSTTNMALVLLLLGITFSLSDVKNNIKEMIKILSIRYLFGLGVGLILYFTLPFDELFRTILIVILLLPVGFSAILYSVQYNYDQKLASSLVNISNVISFIIMWIIAIIFE